MDLGKLNEWNTIMVFQPPNYKTPTEKRQDKAAEKEAKTQKNPGTPVPGTPAQSMSTSSWMPPLQFGLRRGELRPRAAPSVEEMEVEQEPYHILQKSINTPDSNELPISEIDEAEYDSWMQEGRMMEMPGPVQKCATCHGMVHLMCLGPNKFVWGCLGGDPQCQFRWSQDGASSLGLECEALSGVPKDSPQGSGGAGPQGLPVPSLQRSDFSDRVATGDEGVSSSGAATM